MLIKYLPLIFGFLINIILFIRYNWNYESEYFGIETFFWLFILFQIFYLLWLYFLSLPIFFSKTYPKLRFLKPLGWILIMSWIVYFNIDLLIDLRYEYIESIIFLNILNISWVIFVAIKT